MRWIVITKCDSFFITKCDRVYYKLRQVLQSAMDVLQIATGITKSDDYYKLRQYKCGRVVWAPDFKCGGPEFNSSSDCYLELFHGRPRFNSSAALVTELTGLPPVSWDF